MVFIAKRSIESTELLPNGQSSQPNYCQTVNRVNRIIAKWSIHLFSNGQSTVNRVNRFIAKWSIESTDLLPNGQSSQPIYCRMVNPFIANGQSIYRQMVNPFYAKWSIHFMPNGQSILLPMVNPFIANGQSILCQMVNPFYCQWSIHLLPMVNPFIAKWSIHLLPNGESIYYQMVDPFFSNQCRIVNPFSAKWSIQITWNSQLDVQGLEMVQGRGGDFSRFWSLGLGPKRGFQA